MQEQSEKPALCRLCKQQLPSTPDFLLQNSPRGSQFLPTADQLATDKGSPISLTECRMCGHVQLLGEPLIYAEGEATSATAYSRAMVDHRASQATEFVTRFGLAGKKVLEVGCGDGHVMTILAELNTTAIGIDPAPRAVELANSQGLAIHRGYITESTRLPEAPFDAFMSFHVMEHVPDPGDFLRGIHGNLCDGAVGMIEVPSVEQMLEQRRFYDLLADHLSYFSLKTLQNALEMNGFEVLDIRRDWQGEHALAVVKKRELQNLHSLNDSMDKIVRAFTNLIETQAAAGKRVGLWGASHHAVSLMASSGIKGVTYVIDSTEYKQGRYLPVSHFPIVAPQTLQDDPVDVLVVTAPRYKQEILKQIREQLRYDGTIMLLNGDSIDLA